MNWLIKITLGVLVMGVVFFSFVFLTRDRFIPEVKRCNEVRTELRFSCYRSAMEKNYAGKVEAFSKRIKDHSDLLFQNTSEDKDITYAIFGTNCHTFYHAAGDFVATYEKNLSVKEKLALGTPSCTSGYMMGVYKRTALQNKYSTEILKEFVKQCGEFGLHQCSHEIGHILHDKYTYSILKILDAVSAKEYGLKYDDKFDYTWSDKTDLNAPYDECKKLVPESEYVYCQTGIGHNMFTFAEFAPGGFKEIFNECDNVKPENEESCHGFIIYRIGQNEAAPKMLSGKVEEAKKVCDEAIKISGLPNVEKHCYIGIGGGVGLYADSEFSTFEVKDGTIPIARKKMQGFINYCKELDEEDIDNCIAGLIGTPFRKLYQKFFIKDDRVDKIFDKLDTDFQVVG